MTEMTKRKLFFHIGKDRGHIFLSYAKEYSCIVIVVMPAYHTDISVFWWHVLLQHMSRFLLATILPSGYTVLFNIMHTMLVYDFFSTVQEYSLGFSLWSIQCKKSFNSKLGCRSFEDDLICIIKFVYNFGSNCILFLALQKKKEKHSDLDTANY